jgi:hypothetical protein
MAFLAHGPRRTPRARGPWSAAGAYAPATITCCCWPGVARDSRRPRTASHAEDRERTVAARRRGGMVPLLNDIRSRVAAVVTRLRRHSRAYAIHKARRHPGSTLSPAGLLAAAAYRGRVVQRCARDRLQMLLFAFHCNSYCVDCVNPSFMLWGSRSKEQNHSREQRTQKC